MIEPQTEAVGPVGDASLRSASSSKADRRPISDLFFLAEKLNGRAEGEGHRLTPAGVQQLCRKFGQEAVASALRTAWGFPPEEGIQNPYAYIAGICRRSP